MKVAASIFSWLGGVVSAIVVISEFVALGSLYSGTGVGTMFDFLAVIYVMIELLILLWRERAVANGRKVACGIWTLLLVSVIGGILTLCIPESDLNGYTPSHSSSQSYGSGYADTSELTILQKAELAKLYKNMCNRGEISKTEYEERLKKIGFSVSPAEPFEAEFPTELPEIEKKSQAKPQKTEKKVGEFEIVELLEKYKKLLDDGAITQEEYDAKKAELLKKD